MNLNSCLFYSSDLLINKSMILFCNYICAITTEKIRKISK